MLAPQFTNWDWIRHIGEYSPCPCVLQFELPDNSIHLIPENSRRFYLVRAVLNSFARCRRCLSYASRRFYGIQGESWRHLDAGKPLACCPPPVAIRVKGLRPTAGSCGQKKTRRAVASPDGLRAEALKVCFLVWRCNRFTNAKREAHSRAAVKLLFLEFPLRRIYYSCPEELTPARTEERPILQRAK